MRHATSCEDPMSISPDSVGALSEQVMRIQRAFAAMRQQLTASGSTSGDGVEWAAYGLLFQLVKAGLVERQSDPGDGRAALLVSTDRGRAAYAAKQEHRQRMFTRVLEGWSA